MKFNAAILREIRKPLVIDELEIPFLEVGQVLVKVVYSSICGRQLGEISGAKGEDKYLPHLLGHEGGGFVVLVGPGVTTVKEGDHVCLHWRDGEGISSSPPRYRRSKGGYVGAGQIATFAQMTIVSENKCTKVSEDFGLDIVALMGCSVTTGLGLINNEAHLKIGQSIAVIGCGGVGLNVIQGASLAGGYPIVAIDKSREKLNMAIEFGATVGLSQTSTSIPSNFNIVVETTGLPHLIEFAYKLTGSGGKTIMVGQPEYRKALGIPFMSDHFTGKILMDSQGGSSCPSIDIPRYLELYRNGKLKLDSQITHVFKLEEINKALKVASSGDCGKVILEMK